MNQNKKEFQSLVKKTLIEIENQKKNEITKVNDNSKSSTKVLKPDCICDQAPEQVRQLLKNKGYEIIEFIDQGSTSNVYKIQKQQQYYAAKVIDHSRISEIIRRQFIPNELNIVKRIRHEFIIKTIDVIENDFYSIIINEYASDGDLISHIERTEKPNIPRAKIWIKQIVQALAYLHSKGIAHRDIKADNVLLCNGKAKLGDFTYSQYCIDPTNNNVILCTTFCGTVEYKAPETLLCNRSFNPFIADIFSLGVLIYTLVTLEFPFGTGPELRTSRGIKKLYDDILDKNWSTNSEIDRDRKLYSLLKQLLNPDIDERITINQILPHPWFS